MSKDTMKLSDESMSSGDFDARAVAQYWFTEAEQMTAIGEVLAWLKSHLTS